MKPLKNQRFEGFLCGMPDRIRTCDLQSRSLTLYPTELRAHMLFNVKFIISNLPGVVKHWRMEK